MSYPTKELKDIERGDILLTRITFEENTSDYYSGHNPFDIITRARTDKDGNISKTRPVIVLDRVDGDLYVAPLTTQNTSEHDDEHQLELKHTEGLSEDYKSYIEVSNVRRIHTKEWWAIPYITKINPEDMENLTNRYKERVLSDYHFRKEKHTHVYVPNKEEYENQLSMKGYTQTENTWTKNKHNITFKGDMVTSSFDLSLEDILCKEYPNAHFTMRTNAVQKPCSPQIDLLAEDVQRQIKPTLLFKSTTYIPRGVDAITHIGRTVLQVKASTDHGAVSELGAILFAKHKLDYNKLPEFVAWYEEEHGLDVINPVDVKTDFSHFNLSPYLTSDDLIQVTPQIDIKI